MFLTHVSVNRPIASLMAVLALCLGGLIALFSLPVDKLPNFESNTITIFVGVRGGLPPEDIENLVTIPIEEAVSTLPGLKEMVSVAKKDKTNITLVFDETQNVKRATLEVSERLARIRDKLPKDIEKPIIARYDENDHPIVILSATSSVKTPEYLRSMVERDLKPLLSRVPGVANVDVTGGRQRKILVEFDKSKLEIHKIPILEVIRQLGVNNLSTVSGTFDENSQSLGVNIESQFKTLDEMRDMGVAITKEGSRIRLKDIAIVRDYYLEPESYARVNSQPSVSIYVQKENNANTITAAEGVVQVVRDYEKTLPSNIGLGISNDQSVSIKQAISDVRGALTWGALLTAFILWLFLKNFRHVGVIVMSIPVAVLGAFFAMFIQWTLAQKLEWGLGMTINVMSLLGIALGIGKMVDDSIVVFDNILRRTRKARKETHFNLKNEIVLATQEMAVPVFSTTVIMMVAFLPIVFISPEIRRLFMDVAFTVMASLIASLMMAVTLVPLLCSRFLGGKGEDLAPSAPAWIQKIKNKWAKKPSSAVKSPNAVQRSVVLPLKELGGLLWPGVKGLSPRAFFRRITAMAVRKRFWVLGFVALSAGFSIYLYGFVLEKEFLGSEEAKEFVIFVELPSGTKLDVSDKVVSAVENEINQMPEVKDVVKTVSARVEGWSSKIYVTLKPSSERTKSVQDVIDALRPRLKPLGAEYDAFIYYSEPTRSKEALIDVFGKDYFTLREVAISIAKKVGEVEGLRDVKLRYKPGRPELKFVVDHERAAIFGLSSKDIADTLHAQIRGLRATYFNAGNEQVETVARLSEEDRRTVDKVANLSMIAQKKERSIVPIYQVLNSTISYTPSEVWRRDKERMIQVSANRERMALSTAVEEIQKQLVGLPVPVGYYYEIGGDYKKLIQSEREFMWAFIIMLVLVYMVLASFFESYGQPFIMILSVPLATAGSMPTLWLTNTSVNMGVYIGLLLLGGTVVSNAIILIDRLNAVKGKRGLYQAVLKVGLERARPIFMTSATTMGAMLPLTLSRGESADLWAPLAITVVSGLALSCVLTLLVIPAAYVVFEKFQESWNLFFKGKIGFGEMIKANFR